MKLPSTFNPIPQRVLRSNITNQRKRVLHPIDRYPILALWFSYSALQPPPDKPVTSNSEFHLLHPRHAEVVPICKWELTSRHRTSGRATNPTIRGPNQTGKRKVFSVIKRPSVILDRASRAHCRETGTGRK